MDMSNRALALILVAAIVMALGGTIITLNQINPDGATGMVSGSGKVNLSISSNANCRVDTNVSLGTGSQPGSQYILSTDRDNTALGFQSCLDAASAGCQGLQINNTGNVHLNISFSSDVDASTFLVSQTGLDATDFRYYLVNGSAAINASVGCRNITNMTAQTAGIPFNVATSNTLICRNLTYTDGQDTMHLEFNITLEPDVLPGTKNAILTITCEQV
jgi:hypothetical protein